MAWQICGRCSRGKVAYGNRENCLRSRIANRLRFADTLDLTYNFGSSKGAALSGGECPSPGSAGFRRSSVTEFFILSRTPALVLLFVLACAAFARAQDTVTIPKARLEELERKEAELEKLKKDAAPLPTVANPKPATESRSLIAPEQTLPQPNDSAAGSPKKETPIIASLPPIEKDQEVSAMDLAAHYRADAAAADRRYRKRTFKVQGEIVGFEKPPLIRNYNILLKTSEPQTRIICDFYPAEKFKAVYTINGGTALVGTLPDSRVPIAQVGDKVVIEGRCKGMSGGCVKLTDCELKGSK